MDVHEFPGYKPSQKEPLLLSRAPSYEISYSSKEDVAGKKSKCRIITISILILATIFLPAAILIDKADDHVDWYFPWNSWLIYVFIVNTTVLMVGGEYIVSSAAYPYSNSIMVRNLTV